MKFYGQFSPPLDKLLYERYFLNKHSGFFLECGATDGVTESTCKFFEESMKWTGINIEPVPFLFERLIRNRPKAHNLSIALSDRDGKATFTHAVHPLHGWLFGNEGSFGAPGAGGSLGFADPQAGIGYAYVTSQMGTALTGDPRDIALRSALYKVKSILPARTAY